MAIKIHELAKELNIQSRDLLDKCVKAGIQASSHMSSIQDQEADRLRAIFEKKQSMNETKIVKAAAKKTEEDITEEAPRTTKKATLFCLLQEEKFRRKKASLKKKQKRENLPLEHL